jgi:hypothetical protein
MEEPMYIFVKAATDFIKPSGNFFTDPVIQLLIIVKLFTDVKRNI